MTIYSLDILVSLMEPIWGSMSSSNCCFLTCIQISQKAGQVVLYSYLFKNLPQFVVIHTVKGFVIVNKAEVDIFGSSLSWAIVMGESLLGWKNCGRLKLEHKDFSGCKGCRKGKSRITPSLMVGQLSKGFAMNWGRKHRKKREQQGKNMSLFCWMVNVKS